MPINAEGYFNCLKSYLNTNNYEVTKRDNGRIVLEEKVYWPGESTPSKQKVRLGYSGDVIVIRLDKKNPRGNPDPLFHFLEDEAKPWAKRCDFVVFQFVSNRLNIYCIEFKSAKFQESAVDQLNAGEAWCRSLHSIIKLYTSKAKRLNLRKYIFTCMDDPSPYVDADGYLKRDHSIRHFHYDDLTGIMLDNLENTCIEQVG